MIIATPPFSILLDIPDIMSSIKTTDMYNKRLTYVADLRIGKRSSLRQCQSIKPFDRILDMHTLQGSRITGIGHIGLVAQKINGNHLRKSIKPQLPSDALIRGVIKKLIKKRLNIHRSIRSELKPDHIFPSRSKSNWLIGSCSDSHEII